MTSKQNAAGVPRLLPNIAVMGKMGSGKTTVADLLGSAYGYERASFAAKLKDIAAMLWGTEALHDRGLMQVLGRKMREMDPMVWVNALIKDFGQVGDVARLHGGPIVIDDLRFPNEYHELRKRDFIIVRVEAHRNQRVNRLKAIAKLQSEDQLLDESETALNGAVADHLLTNTTTTAALREQVIAMVEREVRRRA